MSKAIMAALVEMDIGIDELKEIATSSTEPVNLDLLALPETFEVSDVNTTSVLPGNKLLLVVSEEGGEGQGDHAEVVFGVFDILAISPPETNKYDESIHDDASVSTKGASFIYCGGFYDSYNGTEWDDLSEARIVTPKPKIVVDWVAV